MESLILSIHSHNHYQIISAGKFFFIETVTFSDQTGQVMPHNTISDFLTNGYSNSIDIQLVFPHIHN